jgi:hypothetical protein
VPFFLVLIVLPDPALPKSYWFSSAPRIDDTRGRWRFGSVSHRVKDFPTGDQDFWRDLRLATPFRFAATIELRLAKGTASLEDGHLGHLVSGLLQLGENDRPNPLPQSCRSRHFQLPEKSETHGLG